MKKVPIQSKANRNILYITYVIVAAFIGLILYFSFFLQFKSEDTINNSYNARLDSFSDRIVRGKILSSEGLVLAETLVDEAGNEVRSYPYDSLFAHVVGYSGQKGKTGLEALGNFYLLSSHVNLVEQAVNELSGVKNQGDYVVTTLDATLQHVAYTALGDRKGAVIVMEPDTGKVLAMISKPDFNPNTIDSDWDSLVSPENTGAQLLNRGTQGLYPPGSTFKIVTALQYIREHPLDYMNYQFDCDGFYEHGEYVIKCFHETAHGVQDFSLAFANSCNGAFANLGTTLDMEGLYALSEQLLFNSELPLSVPYSISTFLSDTQDKKTFAMKQDISSWEVLQTSIGQGITQISPMHNAMITAAIANGGILMKPYFIDRVENVGGETVKKFLPASYGSLMSAEESRILTELMTNVVRVGTGSAVRTDAYTVAGKTGSAEFETGKETHSWFVGFAPAQSPRIVVSVIVEESGSGGKVAAPIARSIFDTYFSR